MNSSGAPAPGGLIVVGAGPAGRALAHRAAAAGLAVTLVDPAPERPWQATYGMYADDAPDWLAEESVAARSDAFTVFTPGRRVIPRGYLVLDPVAFQRSLSVSDVTVVAAAAAAVTATTVTIGDGSVLTAPQVIDARGTADDTRPGLPRQTAFGVFTERSGPGEDPDSAVLMDWRPAGGAAAYHPPPVPTFSYRIPTAHGRLIEETCLAATPRLGPDELARRARLRTPESADSDRVERVDFPMFTDTRPWATGGALRFGAGGGLMNPATGYSVAQSLAAVDTVVDALVSGRDPRTALWSGSARLTYRLRLIGLQVLLGLGAEDLVRFFDAFFTLPVDRQRAYLSSRDDARGTLRAMVAVFLRCPPRLKATVVAGSVQAAARTGIIPVRSPSAPAPRRAP